MLEWDPIEFRLSSYPAARWGVSLRVPASGASVIGALRGQVGWCHSPRPPRCRVIEIVRPAAGVLLATVRACFPTSRKICAGRSSLCAGH